MVMRGQLYAPSWKRTPEAIEQDTGWAVEWLWMFRRREKSLTPARIQAPNRPAPCLVSLLIMLSPVPLCDYCL